MTTAANDPELAPAKGLRAWLAGDQRSPDELRDAVDLFHGDAAQKQGRFWLLLVLSAAIASAGVLGDSTATVIGAMIVAPLATPIQGVAAGLAAGDAGALLRSAGLVAMAGATVVAIGAIFAWVLPEVVPVDQNSQVAGRISPTLIDLVAATATGLAGAFAIARRDIGDILPGVAIAISLVPPLAVVGVMAVEGAWAGSLGALILFLTNMLAMVVVGAAVYGGLGVAARPGTLQAGRGARRAFVVIGVAGLLVTAALSVATYRTVQLAGWTAAARDAGQTWATERGGVLITARYEGDELVLVVGGDSAAPIDAASGEQLRRLLEGKVPSGTPVVVNLVAGDRHDAGAVP